MSEEKYSEPLPSRQRSLRKAPLIETPAVCTVKVDNKEIKYSINSIELKQYINNHHTLEVSIRQDVAGDNKIEDPTTYANFLAKSISLGIVPEGGKVEAAMALEFIGTITEVRFENSVDDVNVLIITAKSPTISMDGPKKNSFSFDQKAGDIIGGIVRNYPITVGKLDSTKDTLSYSVQYRETDYEYVMRLAAAAGKFSFYDGKEFRMVSASSADEQELKWRELLGSFSLGLGTIASNFTAQVYNYEQDKSFGQDTSSISASTSLSPISKKSPDASKEIFKDSGYSADTKVVNDAQSLDAVLTNEKSRALGDMIKCYGHSIVPKVAVGHCVKVTGLGDFSQQYWVTQVTHIFDKTGKYHNKFECVPLDIAYPTNRAVPAKAHTKIQTAKVVDNVDPDGMGRVKVKFPWNESDETIWIRYTSTHAGKDRGFYWLPEIDDEVLVAFEEGDPDRPIVIGSLYNKTQTPPTAAEDNNPIKMFKSKSGNQIVFTDDEGGEKIEISQKDGKNTLVLDLSGPSISFESSGGDISLKGNNITIEADSGITLKAGSEGKFEAGSNMTLKASANQTIEGSAKVDVKGGVINLN